MNVPVAFPPVGTALNDLTWEDIRMISDAGRSANYFAIGDTKTITINGEVGGTEFTDFAVDAFIIGIDHNADKEGANRIHFKIGKLNGIDVALIDSVYGKTTDSSIRYAVNPSVTTTGGWNDSQMRRTILGNSGTPASPPTRSLLLALSSDLLAVMKSVTKYSDNKGNGSTTITGTEDYIFLLSEFEYFGVQSYANVPEQNYQEQYDYYKAGNSKVHYRHSATGSTANAWCRSVNGENYFCYIDTTGSIKAIQPNRSYGVAPAFCV